MTPAFDIIERAGCFKNGTCCHKERRTFRRILFRSLLALLSALLAMSIPKFGLFINLTGAVSCTFLAFILPVILKYLTNWLFLGNFLSKTNGLSYSSVWSSYDMDHNNIWKFGWSDLIYILNHCVLHSIRRTRLRDYTKTLHLCADEI